jgi:hypothetical protein
MGLGTVVLNTATVLEAASAVGGPYSPISDIQTASKAENSTVDKFPVFQGATHQIPQTPDTTVTLNGLLSKGDDGQNFLRAAAAAQDKVFVKLLPDGTNGKIYPCRVGTRQWDADAQGGLQKVSFTLAVDGSPTGVGDGEDF